MRRCQARPLGHDLHYVPVQRVILISERRSIALPQARAVAVRIIAIGFIIRRVGDPRRRLRRKDPAHQPIKRVVGIGGSGPVRVGDARLLAVRRVAVGGIILLQARADRLLDPLQLTLGIVDIARDPVEAMGARRPQRARTRGKRANPLIRVCRPSSKALPPTLRISFKRFALSMLMRGYWHAQSP